MTEKYYVTMTDKFMSNWIDGETKNKINKYIVECDSYQEAEIVKDNAENRSEMKNVNIAFNKPKYPKNKYVMTFTDKTKASKWFKKNAFK